MTNNTTDHIRSSQGIWLRWTLANFAAAVIAILAVLPVAVNLAYADQPAWLRGGIGGAALGLALGIGQWWVLRRALPVSTLWIFIALLGGASGLAIGMQLAEYAPAITVTKPISRDREVLFATSTALSAAISGLLFGLLLGLWQWFILRQHVPNAAWWIVANASGWAAALGVAALVADGSAIAWLLIAGSVNGVITGWLLQRWLNESNSATSVD